MSDARATVLLVDDRWQEVQPLLAGLPENIAVVSIGEAADAIPAIECHPDIGAVLLDLRFDGQIRQGQDVLDEIKQRYPKLPVIILTASSDVALALDLVHGQRKAHYYFVKGQVDTEQLAKAVENSIGYYRLALEKIRLTDRGPIVGPSISLERALQLVAKAAEGSSPVLLTGEPGTGKELFARAIYLNGARRTKPFVAVNCGALPPDLVASELFGTVAGAFTNAKDRKGYFEQAHQGTLFLDEVSELPLASQATLLRAVEYGEVQRVGGKMVTVDVRIIAATNRDIPQAVKNGEFREDLYYRLAVFPVHLVPLRERPEDIPAIVEHFIAEDHPGKQITPEAMQLLGASQWPGNVRELRSVLNRAALLADGDVLDRDLFAGLLSKDISRAIDPVSDWARRLTLGLATWADLKREFRSSSDTLKGILDCVIREWIEERGERPSGSDLATLLKINRNHVNQILKQLDVKLRDYV